MDNKSTHMDQIIRETYEQYEAPYDASQWEALEKELDAIAPSPIKYFSSITTGLVAVSVIFMSMLLFVSDINTKQILNEDIVIEEITSGTDQQYADNNENESERIIQSEQSGDTTDTADTIASTSSELDEDNTIASAQLNTEVSKGINAGISSQKKVDKIVKAIPPVNSENPNKAPSTLGLEKAVRTGCTGLTIAFEASEEYGKDAKYLWNFGDGFFSNEANPSHTFKKQGTFDVSLSVTSYTTGQITSNVVQAMIDVVEAPVSNMDFDIKSPTTILLSNKSYRADEVEWIINNHSKGTEPEIQLNLADNTRFEVQLSAVNAGGCTDTLTKAIKLSNERLNLPKHIDFNNGHEILPANYVNSGKIVQFKVYDTKDELIFTSNGNQIWTGNNTNDQPTKSGDYIWVMAIEKANEIMLVQGSIKVL